MNIAVFSYNWPHRKTQDFLFHLWALGHKPKLVLAADPVKLNIPHATVRTKPKYRGLLDPKEIAERMGVPYRVLEHNSEACSRLIKDFSIDVGIIAGARILKKPVIGSPRIGIVNFHPGVIPQARGLDALQWSLFHKHPLGVTAHLIDERVDAGTILLMREIEVEPDDTLIDLGARLHDVQLEMLPHILHRLQNEDPKTFPTVEKSGFNRKMPPDLENQLPAFLEAYKTEKLPKK